MENLYYPARTQWAHLPVAEVVDGEVALRGRMLDVYGGKGKLQDQTGEIELKERQDEKPKLVSHQDLVSIIKG